MKLPLLLCLAAAAAALPAHPAHPAHPAPATDAAGDADKNATEILKVSETADPAKREIVKQIKRLNDDGSYTIGYEADDGTFKIESRDVRGNVKGTFGYIDQDGEIKRVAYSSSSDSTPVPVSTTVTSTPTMIVRVNKTVSTTRRPLGTVVYPTRSSTTTRATVVQSTTGRRRLNATRSPSADVTTERQKMEETTSNILNLYKSKTDDSKRKHSNHDDLIPKPSSLGTTTKAPHTVKPVYEHVNEKTENKAIRRELGDVTSNTHMIHLQQSVGDDSTDVYGGHISMGTVRPLFTTTTPRPRLVPFQSIIAARHKLQQQFQNIVPNEHETTIEASTGRVFDQQSLVTSNPVPVIHLPPHRDPGGLLQQQPYYIRDQPSVHFRSQDYMRDNPGSPIPIGNQRPYFQYQNKLAEQQTAKDTQTYTKSAIPDSASPVYDNQPVTRIIPIPVDERGIPLPGIQARFVNNYRPITQQQPPPILQQRLPEPTDEINSITTPVSTRDLKRLLQILIVRQNHLQALMDQLIGARGAFQPLPVLQRIQYQPQPRYQNVEPRYQDRYDYRYDRERERYEQENEDVYYNQVYEPQYESRRFIPKRRILSRAAYDTVSSSSNHIEEIPEYLPADVREALLLKMLMLAISPDFMPTPIPATELTTAAPTRKQVRNIQILGEEGSTLEEMKRPGQRH